MLWRSLGDVAPVSATLADGGRAELIYPDHREIRTWPSFELLDTEPAEHTWPSASGLPEGKSAVGAPAQGDLAAELTRTLGGSVSSVSACLFRPGRRALDRGTIPTLVPRGELLQVRAGDDTGNGAHQRRPMLVSDR